MNNLTKGSLTSMAWVPSKYSWDKYFGGEPKNKGQRIRKKKKWRKVKGNKMSVKGKLWVCNLYLSKTMRNYVKHAACLSHRRAVMLSYYSVISICPWLWVKLQPCRKKSHMQGKRNADESPWSGMLTMALGTVQYGCRWMGGYRTRYKHLLWRVTQCKCIISECSSI
jgi:hypothetical protein